MWVNTCLIQRNQCVCVCVSVCMLGGINIIPTPVLQMRTWSLPKLLSNTQMGWAMNRGHPPDHSALQGSSKGHCIQNVIPLPLHPNCCQLAAWKWARVHLCLSFSIWKSGSITLYLMTLLWEVHKISSLPATCWAPEKHRLFLLLRFSYFHTYAFYWLLPKLTVEPHLKLPGRKGQADQESNKHWMNTSPALRFCLEPVWWRQCNQNYL